MRTVTQTGSDYSQIIEFLKPKTNSTQNVSETVKTIINEIMTYGDSALVEHTNRLDHNSFNADELRVTQEEIEQAYESQPAELIQALELAVTRITDYYKRLLPENLEYTDSIGTTLGARWLPIESVGLYVPGGKASYPSSVLMNAIPAIVAGVSKIAMVTPAANGKINSAVLAAAKVCGIKDIFKIGGAQAVAALTYGTKTVPKVDKIVGPGNAYVAEAKRQVFGIVGIDMIAGPSEILVIADENNDPNWLAADLLSQAEHDEDARSNLITTSQAFAQKVIAAVYETMQKLERKDIARFSIENNGLVIVVDNLDSAAEIANIIAAEHLELAVADPKSLADKITNAGAIFFGKYTPEAIGDYIAGPSHVLPTSASARFSSGLSVTDFMKRQSLINCSETAFKQLSKPTALLAKTEGLTAHELSILVRSVDGN